MLNILHFLDSYFHKQTSIFFCHFIFLLTQAKQERTQQQEEKMDNNKIQTAAESICPYDAVEAVDMDQSPQPFQAKGGATEWRIQTKPALKCTVNEIIKGPLGS